MYIEKVPVRIWEWPMRTLEQVNMRDKDKFIC